MNAGAGALAVTVDGPSKVQLDCREVAEGTLSVVRSFVFLVEQIIIDCFSMIRLSC